MNMRLLVLPGCVFALGWILSRMYYDTSTEIPGSNPVNSTPVPRAAIEASQLNSRENAVATLQRPGKGKQYLRPASVFDITLAHLLSRPAISEKRLSLTSNGNIRCQLKTPYRESLPHER